MVSWPLLGVDCDVMNTDGNNISTNNTPNRTKIYGIKMKDEHFCLPKCTVKVTQI